uniref:Uncharacterized protein n=1 Tax=Cacopsylla melanoneura TaxID=428564 RepID=A0A8D8ZR42_9HEMI
MGKCEEKFCSRKGQEEKQTAKLDSLQMGTNKESENKRDVTTNMYKCCKRDIERRYHGVSQDKSNINDYTFNNAILESILKNRTFILPDMSSFGTKPETINLFIPNIVPLPRTIGKHLAIQSKTHERRRLCTQLRIKDGISRRSLNKVRVLVSKPKNRLVKSPRTDLFESVTIDKVKYKILRKIYVKSITKPQTKSVEQDKTICTIETKIKKVPLKPVIGLRNSKLNSNKSKRDQIISELNATKIERTARVKQIKCSLENINASRRKSSRNKHKKDQPTTKGLENVIETRKNFDRFSAENLKKTGKKRSSDENTDLETHSPRSDLFFSPRNDVFLSPRNGNFDEAYKTLFKHFTYQVSAEDIRQVTQSFRTENDEGEETNAKRDLPGLSKTHEQVKEKPKTHDNVIINSSPIMEYETLKHSENNVSPTFKMTDQDTTNKTVAEDMDQFTRSSNHAKVVEEDVNANTNIGRTRKELMRDNTFKSGDVAETRQFETNKTTHKVTAGTNQMSQSFRPSKLPVDDVKALSNARNNDTGDPKKLTKDHGKVIENRMGNETTQLKNTHQPNEDEAFDLRTRNNQNLKESRDLKESNDFQQQTGSATIRNSRFMNSVPIGKTYNGRMSSQTDRLSSQRHETPQEKYNGTDVGSSSRIAQYSNIQTRRSVKKQGSLKYKNNNDNIPIEIKKRIVPEDCTREQGDSRSNEVKDDMFNARKDNNKQEEPSTFHQNNADYVDLNKAYTDFILAAYSARERLNMIGRMNNETTSSTETQYNACLGHPIVQFDTPSGTFQSHPDSFNTDSTTQWTNNVRAQTNKLVIINEKLQSGAYCNVQKPMCTMRPPLANNTHTKYAPISRPTQLLTRTPVSKHAPPQKTQTYFFTPNLGDKIEKGPDNFENGQTSTCRPVLMSNECKCPLCIVQKNRPVPASQNPRIYNRLSSVPQNFIQYQRPPPQSHRYQPNILYQKNRMANENTPQMNRVLSIRPIQTLTNTRPNLVVSNEPIEELHTLRENRCHGHYQPVLLKGPQSLQSLDLRQKSRRHNQAIQNRCGVASMPICSPIMPGSPSNVPISARSVSIGPSIVPIGPPSLSIRPPSASIALTHGVNYYGLQKHNEFPQTSLNQTIQSTRRYMHPASIATKQASYVPAISSMVQSDCKENRHSLPQTSFNTPPQLIKMIASNTQTQGIERWDSSGSHVNLPPFHRTFRAPKSSYQHLGNQPVEAAEPMEAAEFVRQLNVPKEPIRLNPKGKHTNCPLVQFNEKNRAKAVHNLPKMPAQRPNQAVRNRNQIEPTMKVPSNRNFEIDNAMENASTQDSNQPNILSFHVVQMKATRKIDQRGQNQHNQTTLIGKGPSNRAAIETTCKNMENWPFLVQNMQDVSKGEQMVLQSTREVTNSDIAPIQTATNMCFQSVEANNQKCQGLLYQRDTRRTQDFNRAANEIDNIQDRLQSVKSLRQVRKPSQLEKLNQNGEYLSQLDNPDINQLDNLKDNDDTKDLTNEDQSERNKLIISIPINRSESTEPCQSSTKHRTTATTTRTNNETQTEEVVILDFDETLINILEDNTEDISLNQQMDNKTEEGNLAVKNEQVKHLDNNIEDGSLAADQLRNTLEDGNVP